MIIMSTKFFEKCVYVMLVVQFSSLCHSVYLHVLVKKNLVVVILKVICIVVLGGKYLLE